MATIPKVTCECADPLCPACKGRCTESASVILLRVDFSGTPECYLCDRCAQDAMDSGLFYPRGNDNGES